MEKTPVLEINAKRPEKGRIKFAARIIRRGGLVAFPTETVYGIAANLLDDDAIARLYKVKARPRAKPFTVHVADRKMMIRMGCKIAMDTKALIKKFWPGPLTIILEARTGKKIGFRMPDNRIALDLIKESGVPVVAPSANTSGKTPPKNAKDVSRYLDGKIDLVIDGGKTEVGIESTIVDLTSKPPRVLREGAIASRKILIEICRNS